MAHLHPFASAHRRLVLELQRAAHVPEAFALVLEVTTGQILLGRAAESFIERVDFAPDGDQPAVRIFPAGRDSPVGLDPERGFEAPNVRGIQTDALTELLEAGGPPEAVAEDFGLGIGLVKAAVAFERSLVA